MFSFLKKRNKKSEFQSLGENDDISIDINIVGGENIKIGSDFHCGPRSTIAAWKSYENDQFSPKIVIGDRVKINSDLYLTAINSISIGNNVLIGRNVLISDNSHGSVSAEESDIAPSERKLQSKGPVTIEDNVWIGSNAVILPNIVIGYSSIIGAGAIVTKNVPEKCVVAGNPARVIKYL